MNQTAQLVLLWVGLAFLVLSTATPNWVFATLTADVTTPAFDGGRVGTRYFSEYSGLWTACVQYNDDNSKTGSPRAAVCHDLVSTIAPLTPWVGPAPPSTSDPHPHGHRGDVEDKGLVSNLKVCQAFSIIAVFSVVISIILCHLDEGQVGIKTAVVLFTLLAVVSSLVTLIVYGTKLYKQFATTTLHQQYHDDTTPTPFGPQPQKGKAILHGYDSKYGPSFYLQILGLILIAVAGGLSLWAHPNAQKMKGKRSKK